LPRWRRDSIFGPGPRQPHDRDARARLRFLAKQHRTAGRLSASGLDVAEALERLLGQDGRLDPSQAFLAAATGASTRTVGRQLARLRDLGLLFWQRRLERSEGAWRCEQTSNAYVLTPADAAPPCDRHSGRPSRYVRLRRRLTNKVGQRWRPCWRELRGCQPCLRCVGQPGRAGNGHATRSDRPLDADRADDPARPEPRPCRVGYSRCGWTTVNRIGGGRILAGAATRRK
jgi:hypothetical protein